MTDCPFARATVTRHGLTLNPWRPGLIDGGPGGALLRPLTRRGVVLADLFADRDERDLIVRFVPRDAGTRDARAALAAWAAQVGWRRLWLDDRVLDLGDAPAAAGRARARCRTCGLRWEDERAEFWELVRDRGWFPAICSACGASLPEWEAATSPTDLSDSAAGPRLPSHHV